MELRKALDNEIETAVDIIDMAKEHLRKQGIDQWQNGYPDRASIIEDIDKERGYFIVEKDEIIGYLCADYDGEPAYDSLNGKWEFGSPYVVVHRMAFSDKARGKGASTKAFALVEEMSKEKGVSAFRIDTDEDNNKMKHILKKCGFQYRGTILFDDSEKIAFEKRII